MRILALLLLVLIFSQLACQGPPPPPPMVPPVVELNNDEQAGILTITMDGNEAISYQYNKGLDLVHYWPVRSPSGREMTVRYPMEPEQYPHHRSFWFADTVQMAGEREASFYNAYYSKEDPKDPGEYPDRIRHLAFTALSAQEDEARITSQLTWEMGFLTKVLDETRDVRFKGLPGGEYLMDITFTLRASYGDVDFVSDEVHYAWPFIRMNTAFNVEHGGKITNSEGRVNEMATNMQEADWVDYSNTVDGVAEGLAIFSHKANPKPHKWLTRDYGCFGPRRIDEQSGKKFTLKKGESISCRVGILVHKGDVGGGKVAERYARFFQ